jgi:hypothetical protein
MPTQFSINGYPCTSPDLLHAPRSESIYALNWWNKVNSIEHFRGRRAATAHLLVDKQYVEQLPAAPATVTISVAQDGAPTFSSDGWTITKIEAIEEAQANPDPARTYYVQCKDPRHVGENAFVDNSWLLNDKMFAYDVSAGLTWQQLVNALWLLLPATAKANSTTCPTLARTPVSVPENLNFDGVSVWQSICQALEACGHFPVYDLATGLYRFASHNGTQTGLSALLSSYEPLIKWTADVPYNGRNAPEKVSVVFPPVLHTKITWASYAQPEAIEFSSGASGAIPGTKVSIVDTTYTVLLDGQVYNTTQINNRATDLSYSIYGKATANSLPGLSAYSQLLFDLVPGEQLSRVYYHDSKKKGDYTVIELFEPFEFDLPKPIQRAYSVMEVVLVTSSAPGTDGLYDGIVQRFENGSWRDLYVCKVKDLST